MITDSSGITSDSDEEIRGLLDRRLAVPLEDQELRYLELEGTLRAIRAAGPDRRKQASAVREALRLVKVLRAAEGREPEEEPGPAGSMATNDQDRRYALSRLYAMEAEDRPDVRQFRARHLGGNTLKWEDIDGWIRTEAEAEGPCSQYVEVALPEGATVKGTLGALRAESDVPLRDLHVEGGVRAEFLRYAVPGKDRVRVVPVRAGGVLDELRRLAEGLTRSYSWTSDQATVFVLAGGTPYMVGIRAKTQVQTEHPAASKITLEIDPVVAPQEVLKTYSLLRQKVLKGTYRPLSAKHLQLALFAAERRPDVTWAKIMQEWNETHPEYEYTKETVFARDCTAARNRLLRPRLDADALL